MRSKSKYINVPVLTLSPIFSSDMGTDIPFLRVSVAVDGKQSQLVQQCLTLLMSHTSQ